MSLSETMNGVSNKPLILLCGDIVLAHDEWASLSAIAELRVRFSWTWKKLADEDFRNTIEGVENNFWKNAETAHITDWLPSQEPGILLKLVELSSPTGLFTQRLSNPSEITGRFDQEVIDALPASVKFICHTGAGYDSIDAEACARRGIAVSNTSGAVNASTASTTIYLLLGALRRSFIPCSALRAGQWRGGMRLTHDPEGKLLGILGMGGIGTSFAQRAVPFGMRIQYHNRKPVSKDRNTVAAQYVGFEELIRTSDIISIHLPLNQSTRGMIGTREIARMKPGVVIINTARGPIVDESALVDALESGHVFAAGLDVYEKEPLVHEGLLKNEHCVLMPHVGTATVETQRKMEVLVIDNLRMAIQEQRLKTPVSESVNAGLGIT